MLKHTHRLTVPFFTIVALISAACFISATGPTDPPPPKPLMKTADDFLSFAKTVPFTNHQFGDSIKCMSGKFFRTKDCYALVKTEKKQRSTQYALYQLKTGTWQLVLRDSSHSKLRINQRLEDFDFDGVLDFAFCDMDSRNGNKWYTLYLNKGTHFQHAKGFRELPNPIADPKTKSIKSSYNGSIYDQASKFAYTLADGKYVIAEMVTSDRLFNHPKPDMYKICYYRPEGGKLTMQACDTGAISLYDKYIPLK